MKYDAREILRFWKESLIYGQVTMVWYTDGRGKLALAPDMPASESEQIAQLERMWGDDEAVVDQ